MTPARTEFKYLLNAETACKVRALLESKLQGDQFSNTDNQYQIWSQYFDSAERDCYWEKQRRLKSRRKIRVRFYGPLGGCEPASSFLEVKQKQFGVGSKRRLSLPVEAAAACAAGDLSVLPDPDPDMTRGDRIVIGEVRDLANRRGHRPVMGIAYDRTAYVSDDGLLRVTFDAEIRCRPGLFEAPATGTRPLFESPGEPPTVMEVKALGPVPYWFRGLAGELKLTRTSFSKFCTAMEHHDPVVLEQRRATTRESPRRKQDELARTA